MTVILTVEDEFLISEYLGHVLEEAGYDVISTSNADEAIAVLESRNDIRVIITDINIPGPMNGLSSPRLCGGGGRRPRSSLRRGKTAPMRTRCQNKVNSWRSLTSPNEFWRLFGASRSEASG